MLEITVAKARYTYRQSEKDKRVIERRENKHNARWYEWRLFPTANDARRALLNSEKGDADVASEN